MSGELSVTDWLKSHKITGIKPLLRKINVAALLDTRMGYVDEILSILDGNDIDYEDWEDKIKDLTLE